MSRFPNWQESYVQPATRSEPQRYVVIGDVDGLHYFKSAEDANKEFPGAFDQHPDFDAD